MLSGIDVLQENTYLDTLDCIDLEKESILVEQQHLGVEKW
mgnify:CR=1 FL=1